MKLTALSSLRFSYYEKSETLKKEMPLAVSFIGKLTIATHSKKADFKATVEEAKIYIDFLGAILNRFNDPFVMSQRDDFLVVLDSLLTSKDASKIENNDYVSLFNGQQQLKQQRQDHEMQNRLAKKAQAKEQQAAAHSLWITRVDSIKSTSKTIIQSVGTDLMDIDSILKEKEDWSLQNIQDYYQKLALLFTKLTNASDNLRSAKPKGKKKSSDDFTQLQQDECRMVELVQFFTPPLDQRSQLLRSTPFLSNVSNPELLTLLNDAFRRSAVIGDGSTASVL